jgi:integrase/recombinase XerD
MVSIKVILDKRRIKKDNSYPLNFHIHYNCKSTTRSTGISITEDDWDEESKLIKKSNLAHKALNTRLQKDFADLQSKLLLADDQTIEEFLNPKKQVVEVVKPKTTVYQFAEDLIARLKSEEKFGNAWVYTNTASTLKKFYPSLELYFEQIDYSFLTDYNSFLVNRKIKHNSIYLYVRTLRIFYNKAIKAKVIDRSLYPFHDFILRPEKTKKRAIPKDILINIYNIQILEDSPIWHVRNYFILSFCLVGISIIDLALLKHSDYVNGRISYKRKKTGKWYDIKVVPEATKILNYYKDSSKSFLLPIANGLKEDETLIVDIKTKTKFINKYLGKIAELINCEFHLTSYVARHTWATTAKRLGYSNELIAEAMGHEYGNATTAIYLDSFDQEVIDNMNENICHMIFGG